MKFSEFFKGTSEEQEAARQVEKFQHLDPAAQSESWISRYHQDQRTVNWLRFRQIAPPILFLILLTAYLVTRATVENTPLAESPAPSAPPDAGAIAPRQM